MGRARQRRVKRALEAQGTRAAPRTRSRLRRPWLVVLVLIAAAIAFSSALRAPFVLDDIPSIPGNASIEHLSTAWSPPGGGLAVSGRPMSNLSLAVNRSLDAAFGDETSPVGYRVANVMLHLLCGLLLFGIIRRTLLSGRNIGDWSEAAEGIGLAVLALWLLHPIQTDAVDYVVQRTELLVSTCYAATVYASIRAWDAATAQRRRAWYVGATLCCLAGVGSKEVMVSAPLIVLLYDRAFRAGSFRELAANRGRRWFYVALWATLVWLAVLVAGGGRSTTAGFDTGLPWYRYLYSQAWAISRYLKLIVWPRGFLFDYGMEPVEGLIGVPGMVLLAIFGVATIVAWTRPRWRWFGFTGTWFFFLLAPSSSIVPIRTEIAAERRVYLASAAVIVMVVVAIAALFRRLARTAPAERARRLAVAAPVVVTVVAAAYGIGTYERGLIYRDPEALWRQSIARRPSNARAYDNLAAVLIERDSTRRPEAERLLRKAIAVDSMYLPAWTNLADVELHEGRTAEGRATLERVLRIEPQYADATARLAGVMMKSGDATQAVPMLERAVTVAPTAESYVTLATGYLSAGRVDDAIAALRRALALDPSRADAAGYLGAQLLQTGHPDEAIPYLETASRAPNAEALLSALLSLAYAQVGNVSLATVAANAAIPHAGSNEAVWLALGRAMLVAERASDAVRFFAQAVEIAPADPEALTRLGIARAASGDDPGAEREFQRALAVAPGYAPAEQAIAKLQASR